MKKKFNIGLSLFTMILVISLMCTACGSSSVPNEKTDSTADTGDSNSSSSEVSNSDEYEWPVMTLTVNDYNVATSGIAKGTQVACDYIEEVSGGNITCDVYFGGTLMESTDSFAGTADGMADITFYLYTLNSGVCPVNVLFTSYYTHEMPNQLGMLEIMQETINNVPEFREEFEKQNLYLLACMPTASSPLQFADNSAENISTPDDLSGKLVMASGYNISAWANHGVSGMSMAPSDWYTNLERGVVDALTLNLAAVHDFGITDVVESYVLFGENGGLYSSAQGYFFNLDAWNELDPNVQNLIIEAFELAAQYACEVDTETVDALLQSEIEAGKTIKYIAEEDMQPWYDLGLEAAELWKADVNAAGYDADAIYDGYMQEIDAYLSNH